MRADRLLAILLLLQRGGRTTAGALASRLEVSVRTIYRDLEALGVAGVPVYSEPGRRGGVRLLEGYRTDLSGLSLTEAELLPLLGLADVLAGFGMGQSLRRTEAKVLMALPEEGRRRAEQARRRIYVDLSRWWDHAEPVPHLPTVVEALFAGRKLQVDYRRAADTDASQRTLHPYGIVVQGGTWYLVARARGRDPRTYRVSRIVDARMLDAPHDVHADFDLEAFWTTRKREFESSRPGYAAVVRATASGLRSLRESHAGESMTERHSDGRWTTADVTFETRWLAVRQLLSYGASVEVLEPHELRRSVAGGAAATAALYTGDVQ